MDDDCCIVCDEAVEKLFEMLLNGRRAKGWKEIDGTMRAANIVRMIVAGYINLGLDAQKTCLCRARKSGKAIPQ